MEEVAGAPIDERSYGQPRWVRVEGLHLTLRFLGATPDERLSELASAIANACRGLPPFAAALAGGGAFPSQQRPRVLWLDVARGAAELEVLTRRLDAEMQQLGWPADDRPLRAHLTLARTDGVPGAADAASRLVAAARDLELRWQVDRLVLYRSLLGRGPARYESLAEARLG
jgi:2'-5' RNA ligase